MPQQNANPSEQLQQELKALADTLEEVLSPASDKSEAELNKIKSKAEKMLKDARQSMGDARHKIVGQTKDMAHCADKYVHEKPWNGIAAATAIGVVLGMLLSRR